MKKPNYELKQSIGMTDDKGNFIEFIGSEEESRRRIDRILRTYCRQIRPAITEGQ